MTDLLDNVPVWFNYQKFYDYILSKNYTSFVEVGVWAGEGIVYLSNHSSKDSRIFAVDLFEDTYKWTETDDHDPKLRNIVQDIDQIYRKNIETNGQSTKITSIKSISWEGPKYIEDKVDFVFIDADHSFSSVTKDINSWLPMINNGGIIAGHDYRTPETKFNGVKSAVDNIFGDRVNLFESSVWYVNV